MVEVLGAGVLLFVLVDNTLEVVTFSALRQGLVLGFVAVLFWFLQR